MESEKAPLPTKGELRKRAEQKAQAELGLGATIDQIEFIRQHSGDVVDGKMTLAELVEHAKKV